MANIFTQSVMHKPKRNVFDLSHERKFSMEMGRLYPCLAMEVLPGDTFKSQSQQLVRFAPLVAPVMHNVEVFTHYFFVPNRIQWDGWEDFITGGRDGSLQPAHPIHKKAVAKGSISDYLGCPIMGEGDAEVNAFPLAAYGRIWNEYYRDQNLQEEVDVDLVDGDNSTKLGAAGLISVPWPRAWEHDYFTSALPFAQRGPEATIPIGGEAEIKFRNQEDDLWNDQNGSAEPSGVTLVDDLGDTKMLNTASGEHMRVDNSRNLYTDLTTATAVTINALRNAFRLQEWYERAARGGARLTEAIYAHFGVKSSDARLQRPEYLGGGKSRVAFSEVLQMSASQTPEEVPDGTGTPQGNMSGHGINVGESHSFSKSFEEHGWIIGIISIRPKTAYSQGLPKAFSRFDKFDYYWPSFAHLGEQEIKNKELMLTGNPTWDEETFGYIPRYSEYRYQPSTIHGDFRETLEYWHLGRKFSSPPVLNEEFIQCTPDKRIFAVQDLPDDGEGGGSGNPIREFDSLYCHMFHDIKAIRPLPKYGIPTI